MLKDILIGLVAIAIACGGVYLGLLAVFCILMGRQG